VIRIGTAGDDAERRDAEERRIGTAGDDAERRDAEERRH
jgi:segregation and condensation protein B